MIKEYRIASLEFRRIASNMLRPDPDYATIQLTRFKQFIDKDTIVGQIVRQKLEGIKYDFHDCFKIDSNDWNEINPPVDENQHFKAQYDYMTFICESNTDVKFAAYGFFHSSNSWSDIVQNFLDDAFKSMVDYITDSLSKEIMLLEEEEQTATRLTQNIENVYGTVNQAQGNITATNATYVNEINDICKLISELKPMIDGLKLNSVEKEDLEEDLEAVEEEIKKQSPKKARLRKAINGITNFITMATAVASISSEFIVKMQELVNKVEPILQKLQQIILH